MTTTFFCLYVSSCPSKINDIWYTNWLFLCFTLHLHESFEFHARLIRAHQAFSSSLCINLHYCFFLTTSLQAHPSLSTTYVIISNQEHLRVYLWSFLFVFPWQKHLKGICVDFAHSLPLYCCCWVSWEQRRLLSLFWLEVIPVRQGIMQLLVSSSYGHISPLYRISLFFNYLLGTCFSLFISAGCTKLVILWFFFF